MHKQEDQAQAKAALRRAAEERHKGKAPTQAPQTEVELRRLQHELEVHQVELEMQNEELQASQAEIQAGLERYSDLFDFAPVGYFDLATDGTVRLVNLTGASLVGFARAELTGRRFEVLLTRADRTAFGDFLQRVFVTQTRQAHEITLLKKDQTRLHAHLEAAPSPDGRSCRLSMFDITERKRAETEKDDAIRYIQTLLAASPIGILTYKATGQTLSANAAAAKIVGTTIENLKQQNFRNLDSWKRSGFLKPAELALATGQEQLFKDHAVSSFGAEVWAACRFVPFLYGGETHLMLLIQDIGEHHRAEMALRESEAKFRTIIETSPVAMAINDQHENITYLNRRFHETFGYTLEDIPTLEAWWPRAYPDPAYRQRVAQEWQVAAEKAHREGTALELVDYKVTCKDGAVRNIQFSLAPMGTAHVVILYDITERKQAEAERESLEAQNRQLQKSESLGRMAGAIAHSFNNQLAAVIMNLELALQELTPNGGPSASLSEALQSARKAADISTQMVTYLGQTHAQLEHLDLSETCQRSLPLLQTALPKAVVLETDLSAPGPVINANASQIQQVLTNLLTNAWEASRQGSGAIRLTVKQVTAVDIPAVRRFPIDWQPRDPAYACLEVADSGCGIATGDSEKLFDPFFTSKFVGRGLGLAVVLGIVRERGGCITVESEVGQGSVFRVFLPVTATAVPSKPIPAVPAPKSAACGTVLVIEDERALRTTVTRALQLKGFTVFAAEDGVEGVELFQQHRDEIQCVLCDLTMPRKDGWETLTALRQLAPGLPVILSSGYDDARAMEGHHAELPQAFLHKPYPIAALFNAVNQALAKQEERTD